MRTLRLGRTRLMAAAAPDAGQVAAHPTAKRALIGAVDW
jgi:hypothetical protein